MVEYVAELLIRAARMADVPELARLPWRRTAAYRGDGRSRDITRSMASPFRGPLRHPEVRYAIRLD